jgi:para-nitrobenzyl esterase
MVWLHGGAYRSGSGSDPTTNGSALAARGDIVVVTVNHRLDIFGYLYLGEILGPEYAESGNAGTLDLIAALRWVHDHIEAFGGDPNAVTISGASGGGNKVMTLAASPRARGLFQRGIVCSGHDLFRVTTTEEATLVASTVVDELGAGGSARDALADASSADLLDASIRALHAIGHPSSINPSAFLNYGLLSPVVDGRVLVADPLRSLERGDGSDIALMVGTQLFDHVIPGAVGNDFYSGFRSSVTDGRLTLQPWLARYGWLTDDDVRDILRPFHREHTDRIVDGYRQLRPGAGPTALLGEIVTDADWRMPAIRLAEATLTRGAAPVFMYYLAHAFPPVAMHLHAFLTLPAPTPFEGHTRALQQQIHSSWVSFVREGAPRHESLPQWPQYDRAERATMVLDYDSRVVSDPGGSERALWDGLR